MHTLTATGSWHRALSPSRAFAAFARAEGNPSYARVAPGVLVLDVSTLTERDVSETHHPYGGVRHNTLQ